MPQMMMLRTITTWNVLWQGKARPLRRRIQHHIQLPIRLPTRRPIPLHILPRIPHRTQLPIQRRIRPLIQHLRQLLLRHHPQHRFQRQLQHIRHGTGLEEMAQAAPKHALARTVRGVRVRVHARTQPRRIPVLTVAPLPYPRRVAVM